VADSAMVPAGVAQLSADQREQVRAAVIAGPAGLGVLDERVAGRLWPVLAGPELIGQAQAQAGHVDGRRRVLTGAVTAMIVLGLCLFRRESVAVVTARVTEPIPRVRVEGTPSGSAVSKARARVPAAVWEHLFVAAAADMPPAGAESYAFGLLVTAIDGTVFDLADTAQMRERFTTPSKGRFPQARMVALVACGNRWILAARIGSSGTSEQVLADSLISELRSGTINLADRGFFSMDRWIRASATRAHLVWRVKNGVWSLPARLDQTLPDASAWVMLHESDQMLARRRKTCDDKGQSRLQPVLARLVEFTVTSRDRSGRPIKTSRYRVLTTLLDPDRYPADQIAALYAERWQIELTYARLKTTLREPGTRLRGQTPELAYQELWALLTVYNALARLAVTTAVNLNVDPDAISFTAVLVLTRNLLAADRGPCVNCGHLDPDPATALIAAIADQPLNRNDRQRNGPRTPAQRETERTRDVTYEITITPPELPKTTKPAKV
jgi:Transposase DDE domain/Insertion element 4 transposase N-terminal